MAKFQQRKPTPVFDRVPPQSIDAERSVLGAMLLNPEAVGTAIEVLKDDAASVFYAEPHQLIYDGILKLYRSATPVDVVTLMEQLGRDGTIEKAGGVSFIAELAGAVPTSANIEYYARIVQDAAVLRRLIFACTTLVGEAYESPGDVNTLLDKAESAMFSIAETRQLSPIFSVGDLVPDAIDRIEAIIRSHKGYTGVPSGFHQLDQMLSGFQPSDMVVLAARPSVGKTAFSLNIASFVAIHEKKSVLVFSLEMSKEQLVQRLLCMAGGIDSQRLRSGYLARNEFPKVQLGANKLSNAPIFIDDTPNISILELRSKARRHAAQHSVDLIVIDYLQLMRAPGRTESRQTEIAEISRSIKGIARELRCPVMALSQLSREAEKDDAGTPKLSHLRESGAIEQDADVVIMLSRPPAFKRQGGGGGGDDDDDSGGGGGHENLIHVNIAKQRNGPTGKLELYFDRNTQRFQDPAAGRAEAPPYVPGGGGGEEPRFDHEEIGGDEDVPF
ncbi:MAG: replicative DNA helicase [Candidatus Hydrogenedentes bacterium]|nr:replicative DNA helicase [Candidatus Hydrogenedentota bacterium]